MDGKAADRSKLYWKQELIQKDETLAKLLSDNVAPAAIESGASAQANDIFIDNDGSSSFDAATFLYDLYKTCTVREIE